MKKGLVIVILMMGAIIVGCSKQRALDSILADPQMKSYLVSEMLKSEETRAQIADSLFADMTLTDRYLDRLISNDFTRSDLLNRMLKADTTGGDWIVGKLAEDSNIKSKMKQASK